ncbi:hypothetical protein CQA49_08060 [Helicobacter sp. MIT 00-7814]|uniref:hypothetical protein n=1 Tax=unclassified Helicobacter TaxID=2593540 RepID=UPI000E1E6084|nr:MULTISPECIES: hypothetical protein [unclassified Helicobacter]RDU51880.1 hypothetical protein CQA37_09210 [Helicobacter sp. MIT 99-10781]RDU52559.1 hypothetical protein CQA49_08060 [Helicobacter sp. MIT 00-7814]
MLISEQLKTLKSDIAKVQDIKTNLQDELGAKFDEFKTQTLNNLSQNLTTQSQSAKNEALSVIEQTLSAKAQNLQENITNTLNALDSKLSQNLSTYAQGELLNAIQEAKNEAINAIDTQDLSVQVVQNPDLKSFITQKTQELAQNCVNALDFKPQVRECVEANLEHIPLDSQKIASLQYERLKPEIVESLNHKLDSKLEAEFAKEDLQSQFKEIVKKHAKEFVTQDILTIQNYNTSLTLNALSLKHTYALILQTAHNLAKDKILQELEQKSDKQNSYLVI